jgi:hypothetical protein
MASPSVLKLIAEASIPGRFKEVGAASKSENQMIVMEIVRMMVETVRYRDPPARQFNAFNRSDEAVNPSQHLP